VSVNDTGYASDRALAIHPLVYFADGEEVTIGRPDIDSYAIFPLDGAELVRRLADGATPEEAARWYESEYGQATSVDHVLAALDELGFIRKDGEPPADLRKVRWQRLGRAAFSPVAWAAYCSIIIWAIVVMVRAPALVPDYHDIFFTSYYTLIELGLFVGAIPLILLHESFHALAGRRLGLQSRLRISQRFYYMVVETGIDGLVAVPRRKRYLPILAGMLIDTVALAALIIAADLSREPDGALSFAGRLCLAFAFAVVLRLVWQFFFYVRTDLYVLIATVLGCVDLHTTATRLLFNRMKRLLGLRDRLADESDWYPADRRAAQWYSWLILCGYLTSLTTLVLAGAPIAIHMFAGAIDRFTGTSKVSAGALTDSAVFLGLNVSQVATTTWLAMRARAERRRARLEHVIS
jgi:hypothetical protein